jgi:hypothetical protein
MLYYLIFLNEGVVVSISRFDDEETRDKTYQYWTKYTFLSNTEYDELQIFNEVD